MWRRWVLVEDPIGQVVARPVSASPVGDGPAVDRQSIVPVFPLASGVHDLSQACCVPFCMCHAIRGG